MSKFWLKKWNEPGLNPAKYLAQWAKGALPFALLIRVSIASPYGETAGLGLEDEKSGKLTLNPGVWYRPQSQVLGIDCDIRYPISWRGEQIIEILQQQLETTDITLKPGWRDVAPFYLPESHPVISLLQHVCNDTTGNNDRPYAMGGVTHSKKLPDAITFGPGYRKTPENTPDFLPKGHGQPHGADETSHLPSLLEALPKYVIALIRLDNYLLTQKDLDSGMFGDRG